MDKAELLIKVLIERGYKFSCAESLTGGMLCASLVSVSGCSSVLEKSFVTYSNDAKHELLGVDEEILRSKGAVCEEVASQMSHGLCDKYDVQLGMATTGIAGPTGGDEINPVGTAYISVTLKANDRYTELTKRFVFDGDREMVRKQTVDNAISMALELVR